MFRKLVISALLLLASTAHADDKVVGHMTPLPDELLQQPITLSCGVTIREWHGDSRPSQGTIKMMDGLCSKALENFKPFLKSKGLHAPRSGPLVWNWSLMRDGYCYRCMNDIKFRFAYRFVRQELWGYTGRDQEYSFTVSAVKMPLYRKIFTHEMFHAMSMYYGLYNQHSSNDYVKTDVDEKLAVDFTTYMGYR